jgi:hypothetical protein
MPGKLHELKETTTDAVNIIRELRDPEVQKSIENIKAISRTVNDIVAIFKDPQFVKNIENINLATNHLRESMVSMQTTVSVLNKAGTLEEINKTIRSVRATIDSFSEVQAKGSMIISITNLLASLKQVLEEAQKIRKSPTKKKESVASQITATD